jgi:alpha-N-arabinofuranosidase
MKKTGRRLAQNLRLARLLANRIELPRCLMNKNILPFIVLFVSSAALRAQTSSHYVRTEKPEASIEVRYSNTSPFQIPRTVYGTFLEDIGYSIFGGVSAQLIDNPSFESYDASLKTLADRFAAKAFQSSTEMGLPLPWLPLHDDGWRYEPRWGNAANSDRYLFVMGIPGREVGIRQTIYIPIERELEYEGVLFAICQTGATQLTVSFREHDKPDHLLASALVQLPEGTDWRKLPFRLALPRGAVKPLEPVDFAISLNDGQRVSLDEVRLYPADAIGGLDPEVVKAAKYLNSPLLRYGGNYTSGYHWQDGVGPLDLRPTRLNQSWGYPVFNDFGTDELMNFCSLIGAQPQICLNLGSGTPDEARRWVEYCQGGTHTPGGALRAANGHPDPYHVAAYELGNELWGHFQIGWETAQAYAARYRAFYDAIRDAVPPETMIFANGADLDWFRDWNGALIAKDGSDISYLSTHFVVGMKELANESASHDAVVAADFAVPVGIANYLGPAKAQIDSNPATRGRVKIAFTEWLFHAPEGSDVPRWDNLGGAVIAGGWMNMILDHSDFVPVSDMTGLLEFAGIYRRKGRVFVTPQYWAFSLYSRLAGDRLLETQTTVREYDVHGGLTRCPDIPNVPYLDVLATRNSQNGDLILFVVNRDWKNPVPATLRLDDFTPAAAAQVVTLTSDDLLATNTAEHPDNVKPVHSTLALSGATFHYRFPSKSLTVFTFTNK